MKELQPSGARGSLREGALKGAGKHGLWLPFKPSDPRMNELWSSFILFFPFLKYQSSGLVCGVAADTQGPERPLHPACDFPIEFFPDFTSSSGWDLLRFLLRDSILQRETKTLLALPSPQLPWGYEAFQPVKHCVLAEVACFYCLLFFFLKNNHLWAKNKTLQVLSVSWHEPSTLLACFYCLFGCLHRALI